MPTYAIGDVQGCYKELMTLLDSIAFNESEDTLWFCGDLVNRGQDSLHTLRFIKNLKHKKVVLGNHDLHLLAYAQHTRPKHKQDTLDDILVAPDKNELLSWLSAHPLLYHDIQFNTTLVHAGIYPLWDLATAQSLANEISELLQSQNRYALLRDMYGELPERWQENLTGIERHRFIINAFTRMRFVTPQAELIFHKDGPPQAYPELIPWFDYPNRAVTGAIVFGHWAALGLFNKGNEILGIDTGCVWGGQLTAFCLDNRQYYQVQALPR